MSIKYQKQLLVCQLLELEANDNSAVETDNVEQSPMPWHSLYEDRRRQIVMLWHLCHVPIIHRTQFCLLFKGDPADQIYMDVELRRSSWLELYLAELGNASPALSGDEPAVSVSSRQSCPSISCDNIAHDLLLIIKCSIKALKQEQEYLAKKASSKLTADRRELLYAKWDDIAPVEKQRRMLLLNKLWTDPLNAYKRVPKLLPSLLAYVNLVNM